MHYSMDYEDKKHRPCTSCGSSDGAYPYEDGIFCHVCKTKTFTEEEDEGTMPQLSTVRPLPPITGSAQAISSRGLVKAVAEKYKALTSGETYLHLGR